MSWEGLAFQALDGLSSASGLFFVAAGLSLIFGVTRIINIAHGSFYMLGTYIAVTLVTAMSGALGFWGGIVLSAISVAVLGAAIEFLLLRRIYSSPELFQLLATFAILLIINDAALWLWGPEDLLGPRAPGLSGAVEVLHRHMPTYDVFLIVVAPVVLCILYVVFARTRFGRLVRDISKKLGKDDTIILICRSGDRTAKAADLLSSLGYTKVYSVPEGYEGDLAKEGDKAGQRAVNGWKNEGLPWTYKLDRQKMYKVGS